MAAGGNHVLCVTRDPPNNAPRSDVVVPDCAAGLLESRCERDTRVWAWGHNLFGQLGLGHREDHVVAPRPVAALGALAIRDIQCGHGHSMVLLEDGRVLAFGDNSFGQLGLSREDCGSFVGSMGEEREHELPECQLPECAPNSTDHLTIPLQDGEYVGDAADADPDLWPPGYFDQITNESRQVGEMLGALDEGEELWGEGLWAGRMNVTLPLPLSTVPDIQQVACGDYHTLLLTTDGEVLSCGANCCGQLGHGSLLSSHLPRRVEALANKDIVKVACGAEHSVAVERGGSVWVWGRNIHGQLGNLEHQLHLKPPNYPRQLAPVEMVFQPSMPSGPVRQVACGRDHTVVLFESGELWGCGHNFVFQLGIEHGQNAYYATRMTSLWARYFERFPLTPRSKAERARLRDLEMMSVDEYQRRVEEGQRKLDLRKPSDVYVWQPEEEAEKEAELQEEEARVGDWQQGPRVVQIACGEQHTVAVLDNGHVVACGSGENGQLGIGNDIDANFPVCVCVCVCVCCPCLVACLRSGVVAMSIKEHIDCTHTLAQDV